MFLLKAKVACISCFPLTSKDVDFALWLIFKTRLNQSTSRWDVMHSIDLTAGNLIWAAVRIQGAAMPADRSY